MKLLKQYSNKLLLSMLFILVVFAMGCRSNNGNTYLHSPSITTTAPIINDTNVSLNGSVSVTFNEAINPDTVNSLTFSLAQDDIPIVGIVSVYGNTIVFNPETYLEPSTSYTATITTGVKDLAGNALASDYVWNFTTGSIIDDTVPTVTSTSVEPDDINMSLNGSISVIFSEALDPTTINSSTFTLYPTAGGAPIASIVSYSGNTMVLNPDANLSAETQYTATITTGVKDLAGNALASEYSWSFTTGVVADTTVPTVASIDTINATDVPINKNLSATFSEALDPLTVNNTTFTLATTSGTPVSGVVSYSGNTMVFNPNSDLDPSTSYTATISTGVKDLAGNALASDYSWSFITGVAPDTTAPTATSINPLINATDVAFNKNISAIFSETLDPLTVTTTTFSLATTSGSVVSGVVSYSGNTMVFNPNSDLTPSTSYTATITTGVKDLAGNALASDYIWSFTTGVAPDTTLPTVTSIDPLINTTDVSLNQNISAIFSETLDPLTVTTTTFSLATTSGTPVSGVVSYSGNTMVFNPNSDLTPSTSYTATITTGVKDLAGNALASNYSWSFITGVVADTTTPTVTSIDPLINTTDVAFNKNISAIFSETLDPLTVTTTTFSLATTSGSVVNGVVSYSGNTMVFNPNSDLSPSTSYTATITTGVKDLAGNALASEYSWSFTTGVAPDTTLPTVTSIVPDVNDTNVSIDRSVSVLFSETLDPLTVNSNTFTLATTIGDVSVVGVVSYSGNTAVFNPDANLSPLTEYNVTITTGVKDLAGNALAVTKIWSFTTGVTPDTTAPTVTAIVPDINDTNVSIDRSVSVLFSEALDPLTMNTTTFSLATTIGDIPVVGVVSYFGNTAVFNPDANLSPLTEYNVTITTGVKDLAGNALAVTKIWSFTTAATASISLAPVNLGTAGNFVILAKTAISTTGTTHITGDIGVSPAARTYITGFSDTLFSDGTYSTSPLVTGKIYAANMVVPTPSNMTTAISDMEIAYTDAAGRTIPDYTELYAGDVSGKILTPGLYKWGTGVLITDVGVTISGSATDVWIFQISGDLTVNNGAIVTLAGGALAKNIFWQVAGGTGVSLGTTSDFKGVVLAQKGIVVNTGAVVNGRLLAQTAVTLDANAITKP